jgi:hypothetical protein
VLLVDFKSLLHDELNDGAFLGGPPKLALASFDAAVYSSEVVKTSYDEL